MTDFVISIDGDRGHLTVDGEQPELFGDLVGCNVTHPMLDLRSQPDTMPAVIPRPDRPVVDVTLRLPLTLDDRLTLLRDDGVKVVYGPTGDSVAETYYQEPGPTKVRIVTGSAPDVVTGPGWLEHMSLRGDCVCGDGCVWRAETDGVHIARWLKQHENCTLEAADA